MLTCGFYNSLKGDRKYYSSQMSAIFDGIIRDGVFLSIGSALTVSAVNGMTVKVGSGKAWFNHTWTLNDGDFPLVLDDAELAVLDRIDAVVLEADSSLEVRDNSIKIVSGIPGTDPSRPEMIHSESINQYALAYVYVKAGATQIRQADITNVVGTEETPFVTGILDVISIDALTAQWNDEWALQVSRNQTEYEIWLVNIMDAYASWLAEKRNEYGDLYTEIQNECNQTLKDVKAQLAGNQQLFVEWFSTIQTQLSEDIVGNLQNEIDKLAFQQVLDRYQMVNKTTSFSGNCITETAEDGSFSMVTTVEGDRTIEVLTTSDKIFTRTTLFNEDGSISESFVWNAIPIEEVEGGES